MPDDGDAQILQVLRRQLRRNVQLGKDRHGGRVRTGHLDSERSLNFVSRRRGFDHRERSIHDKL